jgi:hypothetical protein
MAVVLLVTMFVTIPATVAATAAIVGDYTSSMPYVQAVIAGTALTCAGAVRMRRRSAGPDTSISSPGRRCVVGPDRISAHATTPNRSGCVIADACASRLLCQSRSARIPPRTRGIAHRFGMIGLDGRRTAECRDCRECGLRVVGAIASKPSGDLQNVPGFAIPISDTNTPAPQARGCTRSPRRFADSGR